MPLERFLPRFDFRERHEIVVDAPPERALAAVREVTPAEAPLLRALFTLRGLPAARTRPVLQQMLDGEGFRLLADEPGELVAGAVGRPWSMRGGLLREVDFAAFAEPGYAKMAMNLRADGGRLTTETRVYLTNAAARRRFRIYWLVVRPLSGLVRRSWLRAAKRRAESQSPTG